MFFEPVAPLGLACGAVRGRGRIFLVLALLVTTVLGPSKHNWMGQTKNKRTGLTSGAASRKFRAAVSWHACGDDVMLYSF